MNPTPCNGRTPSIHGSARAFTLIEVTLALGVAGFCLLTLFGLLPIGLTSNQTSLEQTMAGNMAAAIVADLRCAQPAVSGTSTSPRFDIPIPAPPGTGATQTSGATIYLTAAGIASGTVSASGTNASRYRATIAFSYPSSGQYPTTVGSRTATSVRVLVTWPALADSTPGNWALGGSPSWPSNYTGSCEMDTTLDRN